MKYQKIKETEKKKTRTVLNNSGLSPEDQEMLKSSLKRRKTIKKSLVVNLFNSSTIMRNDRKSVAISARKAGRQRLRQVTRWDSHDIDTTN